MAKIFTLVLLSITLVFSSCTTTLVSSAKQNPVEEVIKPGNSYLFYKNDGTKVKLNVAEINGTDILGKNMSGKEVILRRSDISMIKQENTLATLGMVTGVIAVAVLIPAYIKNEPVGGR